jgi:hypothetical protein
MHTAQPQQPPCQRMSRQDCSFRSIVLLSGGAASCNVGRGDACATYLLLAAFGRSICAGIDLLRNNRRSCATSARGIATRSTACGTRRHRRCRSRDQGDRAARLEKGNRKGKTRTAPPTVGKEGAERIVTESPYFVARYCDGSGVVRVEPTGCGDETAARQVLADLERRAELVRSNVMTAAEAAIGDHQAAPLTKHLDAFDEHHQAKGVTKTHREDTGRYLRRLAADGAFGTLADLRREALERWLALRIVEGMSARARNAYRNALVSFCNWCVETIRLALNPFELVPKANEKADPRRQRRAMTELELVKLLTVARERPLLEARTVRK